MSDKSCNHFAESACIHCVITVHHFICTWFDSNKVSLRSKIWSSVYNAYSIHKYNPMYVASIGISELQCCIVKLLSEISIHVTGTFILEI